MDHSLPMYCLLIDFCLNQVPFVRRQFVLQIISCLLYILTNFLFTKIQNQPVYDIPIFSWNSVISYIFPFSMIIGGLVLLYIIEKAYIFKLK